MYLAWLRMGYATYALNEDIERAWRLRDNPVPLTCAHGNTPLTCEQCFKETNGKQ